MSRAHDVCVPAREDEESEVGCEENEQWLTTDFEDADLAACYVVAGSPQPSIEELADAYGSGARYIIQLAIQRRRSVLGHRPGLRRVDCRPRPRRAPVRRRARARSPGREPGAEPDLAADALRAAT